MTDPAKRMTAGEAAAQIEVMRRNLDAEVRRFSAEVSALLLAQLETKPGLTAEQQALLEQAQRANAQP